MVISSSRRICWFSDVVFPRHSCPLCQVGPVRLRRQRALPVCEGRSLEVFSLLKRSTGLFQLRMSGLLIVPNVV